MQDLKYDMTIEIMAMNQPTGPDDVVKAAVVGDTAWAILERVRSQKNPRNFEGGRRQVFGLR